MPPDQGVVFCWQQMSATSGRGQISLTDSRVWEGAGEEPVSLPQVWAKEESVLVSVLGSALASARLLRWSVEEQGQQEELRKTEWTH